MESLWNVGIDIGSTTIKLVVMDESRKLIYQNYARHFSEIGSALSENLATLKKLVGERRFTFALTGSAGMGIGKLLLGLLVYLGLVLFVTIKIFDKKELEF